MKENKKKILTEKPYIGLIKLSRKTCPILQEWDLKYKYIFFFITIEGRIRIFVQLSRIQIRGKKLLDPHPRSKVVFMSAFVSKYFHSGLRAQKSYRYRPTMVLIDHVLSKMASNKINILWIGKGMRLKVFFAFNGQWARKSIIVATSLRVSVSWGGSGPGAPSPAARRDCPGPGILPDCVAPETSRFRNAW